MYLISINVYISNSRNPSSTVSIYNRSKNDKVKASLHFAELHFGGVP